MLGVGTSGDVAICHRFVDAGVGQMGNVMNGGVDHGKRQEFLEEHHVGARPDCHTCWVRPVCAGGCYHESYVHFGDTHALSLPPVRTGAWMIDNLFANLRTDYLGKPEVSGAFQ